MTRDPLMLSEDEPKELPAAQRVNRCSWRLGTIHEMVSYGNLIFSLSSCELSNHQYVWRRYT